ncbi:hypothetical protein [Jiella mangrovi]|uniref:DUF2946 domain-containing protein n=1 Tax=Jiella mangrovi TaxID=2821407 RepID=A0ABS4BHL2_9HYPH|nr:hypothetical protein [Jiella mangrovi]MBP0615681.1 hypothetical protein [Jiella mangrovi]
MRTVRHFLRDKVSAAAFVAVLAQLMLLQMLVAGQNCLAMTFAEGPQVLCSGSLVPQDGVEARRDAGSDHCPGCACAIACGGQGHPSVTTQTAEAAPAFALETPGGIKRLAQGGPPPSLALAQGQLRLRDPPDFSA